MDCLSSYAKEIEDRYIRTMVSARDPVGLAWTSRKFGEMIAGGKHGQASTFFVSGTDIPAILHYNRRIYFRRESPDHGWYHVSVCVPMIHTICSDRRLGATILAE